MNERTFFSLSAITGRIQDILQPYVGKLFWVKAEISSGRERGGSFYCDLVESSESGEIIAQMRCTIWSRDLASIRKKFKDHEQIARKIAAYKYPVWTGIGHEIDTSVVDHVANRYFKTPTAVAEKLVARFVEMKRHLDEAEHRFKSSWTYRLDIEKKYLESSTTGLTRDARKLIDNKQFEKHGRFAFIKGFR
jgi:exonuclease VII large subunit